MKKSSKLKILNHLCKSDKVLEKLIDLYDFPDFIYDKKDSFDFLTRTIIRQQLSKKVSDKIINKTLTFLNSKSFIPEMLISSDEKLLRDCGISNNKIKTINGISKGFINNELSFSILNKLNDADVIKLLSGYWGIGLWTAQIFLMFGLQRYDVIAKNDAGLIRAFKILYSDNAVFEEVTDSWKPYRLIGACYLWNFLDNKHVYDLYFNKQN